VLTDSNGDKSRYRLNIKITKAAKVVTEKEVEKNSTATVDAGNST